MGFVFTPLWDVPDEYGHYSYVKHISESHTLPVLWKAKIDSDVWQHAYPGSTGIPGNNWIVQHPPLFYLLAAPVDKIFAAITDDPNIRFRSARLVSALFASLGILFIYLTLYEVSRNQVIAIFSMLLPMSLPMLTNLASGTTHDTLLVFLHSVAAVFFVKAIKEDNFTKHSAICALFLGLACVTKYTSLISSFAILACLTVLNPFRTWKDKIKVGSICGILSLLPIGLWALRNKVLLGYYLPLNSTRIDGSLVKKMTLTYHEYVHDLTPLEHFYMNFVGLIGWAETGMKQLDGYPTVIAGFLSLILLVATSHYYVMKIVSWIKNNLLSALFAPILVALPLWFYNDLLAHRPFYKFPQVFMSFFSVVLAYGVMVIAYLFPWLKPRFKNKALFIKISALFVTLFYCFVFLTKLKQTAEFNGALRATHGRYFFSLFPFIFVGAYYPGFVLVKQTLKKRGELLVVLIGVIVVILDGLIHVYEIAPWFYR